MTIVIPAKAKGAATSRKLLPPHPVLCGTTTTRQTQIGAAPTSNNNALKRNVGFAFGDTELPAVESIAYGVIALKKFLTGCPG